MKTRAITGFFFVIVLVLATVWNAYLFFGFFALVGVLATREFLTIVSDQQVRPLRVAGLSGAVMVFALGAMVLLLDFPQRTFLWIIPLVIFFFIASLYRKTENPFHDIAYTLMAIVYGSLPFLFFIALGLGFAEEPFTGGISMGFLLILWANDTGAYLSGRAMGRHKLFERISPNKTWEGFLGGLVLAVLISLFFPLLFDELVRWQWGVIALIIAVFGSLGDLVESMLKRSLGIKDSGQMLPGHGGILDRFDGLLMAAPLVYLFLTIFH